MQRWRKTISKFK